MSTISLSQPSPAFFDGFFFVVFFASLAASLRASARASLAASAAAASATLRADAVMPVSLAHAEHLRNANHADCETLASGPAWRGAVMWPRFAKAVGRVRQAIGRAEIWLA